MRTSYLLTEAGYRQALVNIAGVWHTDLCWDNPAREVENIIWLHHHARFTVKQGDANV
jgi:hypothetical protein